MQTDERDELDWMSFRFISNEMSATEAYTFEQRLADDQAAREAVARAVELAQAVAAAPADVISFRRPHDETLASRRTASRRGHRLAGWIAAAAAAFVLVGVIGRQVFWASSETTLAKSWARLLKYDALEFDRDLVAESDDAVLHDDEDLTVPTWLIDAVQGTESDKWEDS